MPGIREPFCSLSHLFGAAMFAVLALVLIRRGGRDRWRTVCLSVMASTTVLLLCTSSLYHTCWPGPVRDWLLRADVSAVYLLMAGSVTPVYGLLFQGVSRWVPLILVWSVASGGIATRLLSPESSIGTFGVVVFLVVGWGNVFVTGAIWHRYGWHFIKTGIFCGLSYTFGAIVLMLHQPTVWHGVVGPHELWHVAVLCGMGFHWRFVWQFAEQNPERILRGSPVVLQFPVQELAGTKAA